MKERGGILLRLQARRAGEGPSTHRVEKRTTIRTLQQKETLSVPYTKEGEGNDAGVYYIIHREKVGERCYRESKILMRDGKMKGCIRV